MKVVAFFIVSSAVALDGASAAKALSGEKAPAAAKAAAEEAIRRRREMGLSGMD
jgi:hypothetical protein